MTTALTAAALVFAASVHCLGMCGGFAIAVSAGAAKTRLVLRQVLLQLGKATTYAFLGALAGAFGGAVAASPTLRVGARALAIVAGVAIFAAGLTLLGARARGEAGGGFAAYWARLFGPLLTSKPAGFPLVVGLAMGLLPCPLVYAGLGAAAATGGPAQGALVMAGVALGTVPALALAGALGPAVSAVWRRPLARAAGVLLLVTGLVTIARGVTSHGGHAGHAGGANGAHVHESR